MNNRCSALYTRLRGTRLVWYTYGMKKTTIYLPDALKQQVEATASEKKLSEADVIREAVSEYVTKPAKPRVPLTGRPLGDPTIAERVDELLDGFGK
jgi:hypothetical protein